MIKRVAIICGIILSASIIISLGIMCFKNISPDEFKPAAFIFVLDTSKSNQQNLDKQKNFIKQFCSLLDPEDKVKIIKASEDSYLIYEGAPHDGKIISNSLDKFSVGKNETNYAAYGAAIKKAVFYSLVMKKQNYTPVVLVLGNLENKGKNTNRVNWKTLPKNIETTSKYIPDFTMVFAFANPDKLDYVKGKLTPVLGEKHLIISTEEMSNKISQKLFKAIGR